MRQNLASALFLVALVSCSGPGNQTAQEGAAHSSTRSPGVASSVTTLSATPGGNPTDGSAEGRGKKENPGVVVVRYMLVRRTTDPATADFEEVAESTLEDPRGWQRAGFDLIRATHARFRIVLAEGEVVDRLCLPYETYGTYSCQNGPVVALNADRENCDGKVDRHARWIQEDARQPRGRSSPGPTSSGRTVPRAG